MDDEIPTVCPACGRRVDPGDPECPACDERLRVLCEACLATITVFVTACPECGRLRPSSVPAPRPSRTRRYVALGVLVLVLAAGATVLIRMRPPTAPPPVGIADIRRAHRAGEFAHARLLCEKRIDERGEDAPTLLLLGLTLRALGEVAAATERLEESVALDPDNGRAVLEVAGIMLAGGDPDRALELARLACGKPGDPGAAHLMAGKLLARGDDEARAEALRHLSSASELGQVDADGYTLLAGLILRRPSDLRRARLTAESRDLARARTVLRPLADAADAPRDLRLLVARLDLAVGFPEEALARLEREAALGALPEGYGLVEVEALTRLGRTEDALRKVTDLAAAAGTDAEMIRLAGFLGRAENPEQFAAFVRGLGPRITSDGAVRALTHATALDPDDLPVLGALLHALEVRGADEAARVAVARSPHRGEAWMLWAEAGYAERRPRDVLLERLRSGLAAGIRDPVYRALCTVRLARAALEDGDRNRAKVLLLDWTRWDAANRRTAATGRRRELRADAAGMLAEIEEADGRPDLAVGHYRDVLRDRPDDVPALNNLAGLLARTTRWRDEAVRLARRATELAPARPRAWDTLGTALLATGETADALVAYRRAADLYDGESDPAESDALGHAAARTALRMALAHHVLGDAERAAACRERARELWRDVEQDPTVLSVVERLP